MLNPEYVDMCCKIVLSIEDSMRLGRLLIDASNMKAPDKHNYPM